MPRRRVRLVASGSRLSAGWLDRLEKALRKEEAIRKAMAAKRKS